jgi:hypothetical protein
MDSQADERELECVKQQLARQAAESEQQLAEQAAFHANFEQQLATLHRRIDEQQSEETPFFSTCLFTICIHVYIF